MAHFAVLDKRVEVDLRQLTVVDASGRDLLSKIAQDCSVPGRRGVVMIALVEEITRRQALYDHGDGRADERFRMRRNSK
jgi:hypothetical protein